MKIVFEEQITDRTFKISIDLTGYWRLAAAVDKAMYTDKQNEILDSLIKPWGLHRISYWRHDNYRRYHKISVTKYSTQVIKD